MTFEALIDVALCGLIAMTAVWIVATRTTFAAIVGFVVFGLTLMLAWLRLGAPDVAMTEGAIGGGLSGLLLLKAARSLPQGGDGSRGGPGRLARALLAALCAAVTVGLGAVVFSLPTPAPTLAVDAQASLPAIGIGNAVNGALLGFRAIDTLLEKVVLVLALAAVWCLAPETSWRTRPDLAGGGAPSHLPPLVALARLLPPVGIVLGIFILWNGKDEPGGAFQSASILAATALLVALAGLLRIPPIAGPAARWMAIAGPIGFFAVALAGIPLTGSFLAYPKGWEVPLIVGIEVLLVLSIAATLVYLVTGPPAVRRTGA